MSGPHPEARDGLPAAEGLAIRPPMEPLEDPEGFAAVLERIESVLQFQGRFYKDKCLRRRLRVRMRARGSASLSGYARLLDADPDEYDLLLDALTINVTKFFRNWETWEVIAREVVPRLFELPGDRRAVWSAGCASGEEAYSVAILLHEWAESNGLEAELEGFDILGTDIDRRSLESARQGEYSELSLAETPEAARLRWFSAGPPFRLSPEVRRRASFAHLDLISGEPVREQSLILCRNVIIYFDRGIQEELFRRFYDSLVPGGFLVLGKVETLLGATRPLFQPIDSRERIFRKPP
jgi:chemotaxis protein methyltransferase CheR